MRMKPTAQPRLPVYLRRHVRDPLRTHEVKRILREERVFTVCEEARCPNSGECFGEPTATYLLLGDICTRRCTFCAVGRGRPSPPDPEEPRRVAEASRRLGLRHVVLTSVTRDDLPDQGAGHFAAAVREIRKGLPRATVEVLTPDFAGRTDLAARIVRETVDIFNHNLETVPRLYPEVRPQADYRGSLRLLEYVKGTATGRGQAPLTKSGIMVGLGEGRDEVLQVLKDLRTAGCDMVTIGQYLRPDTTSREVRRYVPPEEFGEYRAAGEAMGFRSVVSGPYIRSSYHARDLLPSSVLPTGDAARR